MFDRIITLNQFLLDYFERVVCDIPDDTLTIRHGAGGNSALWILGHLAVCADFLEVLTGGSMTHPRWVPVFGPGSPGDVSKPERYSRPELEDRIRHGYPAVHERLGNIDEAAMSKPHDVEFLKSSRLKTRGDLTAHLLTTHFSFHLAQLSHCRRESGKPPIV